MAPTIPITPHLLYLDMVEKVNNQTIVMVFNKAMSILYPQGIKYDKVLLLNSDAVLCLIFGGKCLKLSGYMKLLHVTCVAHDVQRVCETIHAQNPKVNKLILSIKQVFTKAPSHIHKLRLDHAGIPLPPTFCITH